MATNPFSVEPPSWFQRLAQPANPAPLGNFLGRIAGTAANAATKQRGQENMNYGERFRTDLANTYKQDADPMWRLREERMRTEMAQFGLNVQSFQFKNQLLQKTALQEVESMKEVEQLQSEVVKNGGGPHGILSTTYTGSNPKTQQYWNNTQLMASRQMTAMRINSDLTGLNRLIDSFDPESRSVALQVPRDETTRLPTPEGWATINALSAKNAARLEAEKKAKTGGGDLIFEEVLIGGKPHTTVRAPGSKDFRLVAHEQQGSNKMLFAKWQAAQRLYKSSSDALMDFKKTLEAPQKETAIKTRDAAKADMDALEKAMANEGASPAPAPKGEFSPAMGNLKEAERQMEAQTSSSVRPAIQNSDGTVSTVSSIGVGDERGEWVISTIVDGRRVSEKEAVRLWKAGMNAPLGGPFKTVEESNKFAEQFHKDEERRVAPAATNAPVKFIFRGDELVPQ